MVTQMPEQHPSEDDQVVVTCPTIDDSLKAHVNFIGREEVHPLELGSSSGLFELSVKCQFCADTFSSMEELSAHISALHTDVEEDPSNRVKVGAGLDKKLVRPREQYISANPPFFCNVCPDKREFEKVLHLKSSQGTSCRAQSWCAVPMPDVQSSCLHATRDSPAPHGGRAQ